MPLLLGVDTGGSYTDAVLYDETDSRVIARAKAPTTHDHLELGITAAVDAVIGAAGIEAGDVDLVSLSTTLATNALVEDKGRRACLVMVGFADDALGRGGLGQALGDTVVVRLAGGHTSHGHEREPVDLVALDRVLDDVAASVDAVAIASQFSVRNPSHELAVREMVRARTNLPVTCSHELSTKLNGPKRALTALLNARLVALIDELVRAASSMLASRSIDAPVMIVRGNGSLVAADFVRERPIETILSGPAASLIGARHLTNEADAIIVDIGGTTTDIAVLVDGEPELSAAGAVVAGHETMVEAIRLHTHGIGGDSEVHLRDDAVGAQLRVGPRRIVPLAVMAQTHGDEVRRTLDRQLAAAVPGPHDGRLVHRTVHAAATREIGRAEAAVLEAIGGQLRAVDRVVASRVHELALGRLVARGLVQVSGFTPTDACHVLGLQTGLDHDAAVAGAELFARRRDRFGDAIAPDAATISQALVDQLSRQSAEAILDAAFDRDAIAADVDTAALVAAALDRRTGTARVDIGVSVPIVALGAPAPTFYPPVADLLGTTVILPDGVEVANAIGAAVAPVRVERSVVVTAPRRGSYRVHLGDPPVTVHDLDEAREMAVAAARDLVAADADAAGARDVTLEIDWDERSVTIDGRPLFVEATATVVATGRPRLREGASAR